MAAEQGCRFGPAALVEVAPTGALLVVTGCRYGGGGGGGGGARHGRELDPGRIRRHRRGAASRAHRRHADRGPPAGPPGERGALRARPFGVRDVCAGPRRGRHARHRRSPQHRWGQVPALLRENVRRPLRCRARGRRCLRRGGRGPVELGAGQRRILVRPDRHGPRRRGGRDHGGRERRARSDDPARPARRRRRRARRRRDPRGRRDPGQRGGRLAARASPQGHGAATARPASAGSARAAPRPRPRAWACA